VPFNATKISNYVRIIAWLICAALRNIVAFVAWLIIGPLIIGPLTMVQL
jgi:hypothetical protein